MNERNAWLAGVAVLAAILAWGTLTGAGLDLPPDEPEPPADVVEPAEPVAQTDEEVEQLAALGYLSGSREAGELVSVTVHDRERAWPGVNLYTSGHANEAFLVDMDGNVLHSWRRPVEDVFPERVLPTARFWRRAALLPDGDLLVIYESVGIARLDRDGDVRWKQANRAHHDLQVLDDGRIAVLVRDIGPRPDIAPNRPVAEDAYVILAPDTGEELERVSILEGYRRSDFGEHWQARARLGGDILHTNAIELLDGAAASHDPAFAAGDVLLSMRNVDAIAILDPRQEKVVWSRKGEWRHQHDPHVLPDGHLLLFDNDPERRRSRALELDAEGRIAWEWKGPPGEPMFSACCGTVQRLPNGDTLVTESEAGRAFEVTSAGEVVWRFDSPHRPPDRPQLVATLFEVLRLPREEVAWLDR